MRIPLAAACLALCASMPASASSTDGAGALARALEGRVAGEPVSCISLSGVRNTRIIRNEAIVYEVGSTLYVNRPEAGAESLDPWDTQVTRTHTNRLCSTDTVRMIDPHSRITTGIVFLGEFVPYRRIER